MVDVERGGCHFFITYILLLCVWCGGGGSKVSLILVLQSFDFTMQGSHPSLYIKTLYDLHISKALLHFRTPLGLGLGLR